jgi:hypothetical protein
MAWPGTRFSVKHCCDCDSRDVDQCTIDSDSFDDDLSKWREIAGDWSTANSKLTGSGPGTLLMNEAPDLATEGIHIGTTGQIAGGDPAILRFLGGRLDANNYVFGQLARDGNSGQIRVGQVVGGIESWLCDEITVEDDTEITDAHALEFCWKPPQPQPQRELFASRYAGTQTNSGWLDGDLLLGFDDNNPASFVFGGAETSGMMNCRGFRFNIEPGSTIDGVEVGILARLQPLSGIGLLSLSHLQLLTSAGAVGDNKATGQAVSVAGYAGVGAGGSTDDWNANLTSEDVTDDDFGVQFTFDSTAACTIEVDSVSITLWYTTPAMTRGRVTLTYTNTEPGAFVPIACAIGITDYEATGRAAGIGIIAGTWEFTEFTLSYLDSPTHTPCPTCDCVALGCESCNASDPASSSYVVDLGGGGWINIACNDCDDVNGEYVVDFLRINSPGTVGGVCTWQYEEELECSLLLITLWVQQGFWRLEVALYGFDAGITTGTISGVLYEFDAGFPHNCQGDAPFTLTKVFELGSFCVTGMPATVTVDVP